MRNMFEEEHSPLETKRPDIMQLAKIDGRWAQVVGGGDHATFLDDGETVEIDWNHYQLIQPIDLSLETLMKTHEEFFHEELLTSEEFDRIHYAGSESDPILKQQVRVSGEYKKLSLA